MRKILFLPLMIIAVSFFAINFESADAVLKNHAGVFDDVRNDDVFGSKVQITVSDMFILDKECNLNQVAVATQWLRISNVNWIESGITSGNITTSNTCFNEPVLYYGQATPTMNAPSGRAYEDYKVRDAIVGDDVDFTISNTDKDNYWSVWVDGNFPVANFLVLDSDKARSVDYGVESEIIPSEKYSNIPNTHFNDFQKYDDDSWVNSDVDYKNTPNNEYHKQRCTDSQHFVAGNVLSIDCNRNTVTNTAPSLATPSIQNSGTHEKTVTISATDPDKDYVQFYLDKVPTKARIYVNDVQITDVRDPIPSNGKSATFVYDSYSGVSDTLVVTATDERVGHSVTKTIDFFPTSTGSGSSNGITFGSELSDNLSRITLIFSERLDREFTRSDFTLSHGTISSVTNYDNSKIRYLNVYGIPSNTPITITYTGGVLNLGGNNNELQTGTSSVTKVSIGTNPPTQNPPVLASISNISINEGSSKTITARATDTNGDTIRYSLSSSPSWVSINSNNGVISINAPSELTGTSYSVTVRATDNDGTDTESFRISINEVNQAPILSSIGAKSIQETSTLSFTVQASDSDRPSQTLRYSMTNNPTGSSINSSTGLFSWTPSSSQAGTYNVTFKVTDNGSPAKSDSETITISVINKSSGGGGTNPPAQSPPVLASISNISVSEGATKTITARATDSNGDTIRYSLSSSPSWVSINSNSGVITISAPSELTGTSYSVTVRATDNDGTDTESFRISINEVNQAPILSSIGAKSIQETSNLSFSVSASDSDRPSQTLRYSMTNNPTGSSINSSTGLFSWTPSSSQAGTYNVTFKVTDNGSPAKSDSETITISVSDKLPFTITNNSPRLNSVSDYTGNTGDTISFTLTVDNPNDYETLYFGMQGAPIGAALDGATGEFSWTPTKAGTHTISFGVDYYDAPADNINLQISVTFTINGAEIIEINESPILEHIPNYTGNTGDTISFTLSASDSDVPAQSFKFSMRSDLTGVNLNSYTGLFTWTPTESQVGTHKIIFGASDSGSPTKTDLQIVFFTITESTNTEYNYQFVNSFGSEGTDNGEFSMPHGIAVNDNKILIADRLNDRVQIFDHDYNHLISFGETGTGDGQFDMVTGIVLDGGFVYVVDRNNDRIQGWTNDGFYFLSFGETGSGDGQFDKPYGVAVDVTHNIIYVTDTNNDRVQIFNGVGVYLSSFGETGTGDGQFDTPRGIDIKNDRVYVTEEVNDRVQIFDLSGNFINSFGSEGTGDGQLESPFGIDVNDDIIAVAERDNNRISIFDLSGNFISTFGSEGSGNGQFIKPHGVTLYDDDMYVVDTRNSRVQVFSYTP